MDQAVFPVTKRILMFAGAWINLTLEVEFIGSWTEAATEVARSPSARKET
jgi:hypothetical protein